MNLFGKGKINDVNKRLRQKMMDKIIIGLALVGMIILNSCAKDKEIGEISPLTDDYILPQGKAPEADARIVTLYEKYGSYFLYEFKQRDFDWKLVDVSLGDGEMDYMAYSYTPADPMYVGDVLDMLDVVWFCFYPDDFLKKTIPYRVLLVSTLEEIDLYYEETFEKDYWIDANKIVISHCSGVLREMSGEDKRELKNVLQRDLMYYWLSAGIFEIPNEFYEVSDYSSNADIEIESENYARHRGFVPTWTGEWVEWSEYMMNVNNPMYLTYDQQNDLYAYLERMIMCTSQEWEEDLKYPLVRQKYDILRNYFKENYGFDVQAIGDAIYN